MGRRPKPKSDDFFERTPSVIEVIAILCLKPLNNCSTVWEHYPREFEPWPPVSKGNLVGTPLTNASVCVLVCTGPMLELQVPGTFT